MLTIKNKSIIAIFLIIFVTAIAWAGNVIDQINFSGEKINVTKELELIKKHYLGKEASKQNIEKLTQQITDYLKDQDYLFPMVEINKNNGNNLNVLINYGSIDEFIFTKEKPDSKLMEEYLDKILAMRPARKIYVEKYLMLLKRVPGYKVSYSFKKENKKIILLLDAKREKIELDYDINNYGLTELGQTNTSLTTQIIAPQNKDDIYTIYGATTNRPSNFYDIDFRYMRHINTYGTKAIFVASHAENNTSYAGSIPSQFGMGTTFNTSLIHPIFINENQDLEGSLEIVHRSSKTNSVANSSAIQVKVSKYYYTALGLNYSLNDIFAGQNKARLVYRQGISGKFVNYSNAPVPHEHYNEYQINISRDQQLPQKFSFFTSAQGFYAPNRTPGTIHIGSRDYGRAYDYATLSGTQSLAASFELRYQHDVNKQYLANVRPYLFYDAAYVGIQGSHTSISHLQAYGAGLRNKLAYDIDLNLEVAIPVQTSFQVNNTNYTADNKYTIYLAKEFKY